MIYKAILVLVILLLGCAPVKKQTVVPSVEPPRNVDSLKVDTVPDVTPLDTFVTGRLSEGSKLLVESCDNYLSIDTASSKAADVMNIKATAFYKNGMLEESRNEYKKILERFPESAQAFEAIKMIAQAYYEEKKFDLAQKWYRKLRDVAGEGGDKSQAVTRIAESIFRMGEQYEMEGRFKDAALHYEKVANEFPDVEIADVALFNSGLAYEKQGELSQAIFVFQRLLERYTSSKLLPKTQFRIARNYEQLKKWDNAAETYLRTAANYPSSELAPTALNNAGFCFENSGKLREAAATYEKIAELYPSSESVADVLFRAGELYGEIKDWESVSRVTNEFSRRFENDVDRAIQALCMMGIAFHMQDKTSQALDRLQAAVVSYSKMENPSSINSYYAAKALFTIGEIYHEAMNDIKLVLPKRKYDRLIREKKQLLERAVFAYSKAVKFGIQEWTNRSIFQIGQVHEDFAMGVFEQERPSEMSLEKRQVLELGIAEAVEKYLVEKALRYHEQNVKLGIREKLEGKYVLQSRKKLTALPFMAARNYLSLVEIVRNVEEGQNLTGFALINSKMKLMQKIAPYQEKAIDLFLKCLEMGTIYEEFDDFYKRASRKITSTGLFAGKIYADVAMIAREAPIPDKFDEYEEFVYKTKLLTQIEDYENKALDAFLKGLKVTEAYEIDDESTDDIRKNVAELLFVKGRSYDLLTSELFKKPPFPEDADEAQKEEYQIRFEKLGARFKKQAFEIYEDLLQFASRDYASGEHVTHAYVRLFQENPEKYGIKVDTIVTHELKSGPRWRVSSDTSLSGWQHIDHNDSSWHDPHRVYLPDSIENSSEEPPPMWYGTGNPEQSQSYEPERTLLFRRSFGLKDVPYSARLILHSNCGADVFVNGERVISDTSSSNKESTLYDLMGKVRKGANILSVQLECSGESYGVLPHLSVLAGSHRFVPKPPDGEELTFEQIKPERYRFPPIKNFSLEK
ncbi:MAG: tetratricopeptide repeat protein [Chitinispirillaceae bacterium]